MMRSLPVFLNSLPVTNGPLTYILNLSLLEGVFPSELKVGNVLPLFKADDDMLFNNYRPVSLLSVLSKVFERIMYNRLISFLKITKFCSKINLDCESKIQRSWLLWHY